MGKSINNPFAANPEMKYGNPMDPRVVRPGTGVQQSGAGTQGAPQKPYVYRGGQRVQMTSTPRNQNNASSVNKTAAPDPAARRADAQPSTGAARMAQQARETGRPVHDNKVSAGAKQNMAAKADKSDRKAPADGKANMGRVDGAILDFSGNNLQRGFIMAEVLGRPRCFRRGR